MIFFLLLSLSGYSQTVVVSAARLNILYLGVENPVEVMVENSRCDSILLTTDNGVIKGSGCNYIIKPESGGTAMLTVKQIRHPDTVTLYSENFRVYPTLTPAAFVVNSDRRIRKLHGTVSKNEIDSVVGLYSEYLELDIDIRIVVTSYSIMIQKENEVVFKSNIQGNKFTDEIKKKFRSLESGNEIFIYNIYVKIADETFRRLMPIELVVE